MIEEIQVSRAVIAELQKENEQLKITLELTEAKYRSMSEQETDRCITILKLRKRIENILSECHQVNAEQPTQEET